MIEVRKYADLLFVELIFVLPTFDAVQHRLQSIRRGKEVKAKIAARRRLFK
jgi:hypothetical protein